MRIDLSERHRAFYQLTDVNDHNNILCIRPKESILWQCHDIYNESKDTLP